LTGIKETAFRIDMTTQEKFDAICWIWIAIALLLFPKLLKITQPYGKHAKGNWGPLISNRIGWLMMELPALLVFTYFVSAAPNWYNNLVLAAIALWGIHYIHRALIFPFRINANGKKIPVVIVVLAILFNSVNGFINGYWLSHFATEVTLNPFVDVRLFIGVLVFLTGFSINQYHDRLLIVLRKGKNAGYQIPYGGLFRFVSCPNFLGEIITWMGFLMVTFSLPALAFLVWTLVNLVPRALDHHKWYRREFADYPASRKAIFPFLW
jgi:3-oxo-5-alpha-steroid 4-dehydrogenase 1